MTYYEFISNLRILKNESRKEDIYEKLLNADIEIYGDMKYRLCIQIMRICKEKIDNIYGKVIDRLLSVIRDPNEYDILITDLKKEIDYIKSFANIKAVPEDCKDDIINTVDNLIKSYYDLIEKIVTDIYGSEYLETYNDVMNR